MTKSAIDIAEARVREAERVADAYATALAPILARYLADPDATVGPVNVALGQLGKARRDLNQARVALRNVTNFRRNAA
jgi:hypothetical protein